MLVHFFTEGLPPDVEKSLPDIVPNLLKRFSSREGYRLFDDVLPTGWRLAGTHPKALTCVF